jgi:hypothetical protein
MAKLGFEARRLRRGWPARLVDRRGLEQALGRSARRTPAGVVVTGTQGPIYPRCSLGEAFAKFKATSEWQRKKPRTREDWERGWKHIAPVFGDVDPRTVALEEIDLWYSAAPTARSPGLLGAVGVREAHRAMKIWRALWRAIGTINNPDGERYCDRDRDPSLGIRRQTPKARSAVWFEGEAVRLVKRAWREGYHGLAAALAVAWDTMLSPVDVVKLTAGQRETVKGAFRFVERTKTSKAVIGTISASARRGSWAPIRAGSASSCRRHAALFTRGGVPGPRAGARGRRRPYTRDKLGKDFAKIRDGGFPATPRMDLGLPSLGRDRGRRRPGRQEGARRQDGQHDRAQRRARRNLSAAIGTADGVLVDHCGRGARARPPTESNQSRVCGVESQNRGKS